jgi:predicted nucleic acid-binding protein
MGFLIDTSIWIDLERGNLMVADIHAITRQQPIFLSPVNMAEFRYGIEMIQDHAMRTRALAFLRKMRRKPLLGITGETGEVFAKLSAKLIRSGRGSDFRVQDMGSRHKLFRGI